jgi:SulP family sulfate permease
VGVIVLGQIPNLLGVPATGSTNLAKAINALIHPGKIELASLLTGLFAAGLIIVLRRTPIRSVSAIVALVLPTVVVVAVGADSVARVRCRHHSSACRFRHCRPGALSVDVDRRARR